MDRQRQPHVCVEHLEERGRAPARWMGAIERLAASGQFAFTLNYYAARGVRP